MDKKEMIVSQIYALFMSLIVLFYSSSVSAAEMGENYRELKAARGDYSQKTWTVSFNQAIDPATATASTFYVLDDSGQKVNGNSVKVADDGVSVTITPPSTGYPVGKTFTVVVAPGIKTAKGTALKQETRKSFTVTSDSVLPSEQKQGIYINDSLDNLTVENVPAGATVRLYDKAEGGTLLGTATNSASLPSLIVVPILTDLTVGTTYGVSIQEEDKAEPAPIGIVAEPTLIRTVLPERSASNLRVIVNYNAGLSRIDEASVSADQFTLSLGSQIWTAQGLDILEQEGIDSDKLSLVFSGNPIPIPSGAPLMLTYRQSPGAEESQKLRDTGGHPVKSPDGLTLVIP